MFQKVPIYSTNCTVTCHSIQYVTHCNIWITKAIMSSKNYLIIDEAAIRDVEIFNFHFFSIFDTANVNCNIITCPLSL